MGATPHSIKRRRSAAHAGFTLIELIIAVALAVILSVIIYSVVISQSRAYAVQDNMTRLQSSLRLSMEFLGRNITMAGYGTQGWTLTDAGGLLPSGSLPAMRAFDGGSGAPDAIQTVYCDPTNIAMTAWDSSQSCMTTSLQFSNTSDATMFADADYMMCFDYSDSTGMKSFLFQVISENSSTGVVTIKTPDNTDYYGPSGQCPSTDNLPRDLQCGPAQILTFYIDDDASDGKGPGSEQHPVLMMSTSIDAFDSSSGPIPQDGDMALADNVEDLQLVMCKKTGSDPPTCSTTGWADWETGDNTGAGAASLREVRIKIWARSEQTSAEARTMSAVNPLTGVVDGYYRQMDSTTVLVRNMRMLEDY